MSDQSTFARGSAAPLDLGADHPLYWVLTGLYVLGAGYFVYLTFFSTGLRGG